MKYLVQIILFLFTLPCVGQNTLFETDFQNGIPVEMSILNEDQFIPHSSLVEYINQAAWIGIQDPDSIQNNVASATSYFENPDTANRWLILPPLTLGSFGNFLTWKSKSHDPSFPDDYLVLLSTNSNSIGNFTDTLGYIQSENFEWTERSVNLSELGYNDSTVYIAFVLKTYDGFKLYLDDIFVESENSTGLHEYSVASPIIYPNPVQDKIHIDAEQAIEEVILKDINGKIILHSRSKSIDLSGLKNGYYFMQVTIENKVFTSKIVKL